MITVVRFSRPEEAHLLRGRLEAAGIPAFVQDEYTVQMDGMCSNAIGGVRLQIAEEDVELAREVLAPAAAEPPAAGGEEVHGPACGSARRPRMSGAGAGLCSLWRFWLFPCR